MPVILIMNRPEGNRGNDQQIDGRIGSARLSQGNHADVRGCLLVIVGDLDAAQAQAAQSQRTFGKLPKGDYKAAGSTANSPSNSIYCLMSPAAKLPTNYIQGLFTPGARPNYFRRTSIPCMSASSALARIQRSSKRSVSKRNLS